LPFLIKNKRNPVYEFGLIIPLQLNYCMTFTSMPILILTKQVIPWNINMQNGPVTLS